MGGVLGKFMTPSPSRPFWALYLLCRNSFFTGSIHKIGSSITAATPILAHALLLSLTLALVRQQLLSTSSRCEPRRPLFVYRMALEQFKRYIQSDKREDLDKAIVNFTESILLPWSQDRPFILGALYSLANALLLRSVVSKQPEDAICATTYLFHLRDQPHEIPSISRHQVIELLVETLALQVKLESGDVKQNIREIAVLSRELFETSDVDATHLILLIHQVVLPRIGSSDWQPPDELIECMREARKHRPDLLEGRFIFAISLACRYLTAHMDDDYEEAAPILDEIITHCSPGNSQDEYVAKVRELAASLVTSIAKVRSIANETPEHLEEAMYRAQTYFSSYEDSEGAEKWLDPELTAKQRFVYFGSVEGVGESSGDSSLSQPVMSKTSRLHKKLRDLLFELPRYNEDTTKIHEAIEKGRSIVASVLDGDWEILKDWEILDLFSDLLLEAFWSTMKIEYLNESINIRRQVIESPFHRLGNVMTLPHLSLSLIARSEDFPGYRTQDLDEALEILSRYVKDDAGASLPKRFQLACQWARSARSTRHPTVSTAYETAMSLMQDTLCFSPTLPLQHATLATYDGTHSLSLDYASYRVDQHQLEEAIEVLERGRALLWTEMRNLRASIDQLLEVDPDLGCKFAAVNQDLEDLTKSIPPSHKLGMDGDAGDGFRAVDPFGRLLLKQRGLLKERAKLISQVQALPGFHSFLVSPSWDTLRRAAFSGPVIIINHSRWRSDILLLLHNLPPSLISTPDDFFERARALKDKFLESRSKYGLDSSDYEETLAFVLAELYKLVGKPVIDQLRQLRVPEQSRIWWCPTSVFCSLPLHAMGPIPPNDGETRYFLDLYICSYTPTLSALIQSRQRDSSSRSLNRPPVLLVAQPDPSLPTVGREIQVLRVLGKATEVSSLVSEAATPAAVIDGLHRHQFVHFACHGTLKTGKPFEAGFELYGDARLTLLDIVRAHLPAAEFAFLSACHTAEVTEGSIMDEGLHLAAAVQYCGFRSVVGTMWAMADIDGRDLAKYFYKELFFSDSRRTPDHERSAKALQFAVQRLRRKRGTTLERWVNFVHYGA
jgi:CHAT domain-containing protein